MIYIGIDPGKEGCISTLNDKTGEVRFFDLESGLVDGINVLIDLVADDLFDGMGVVIEKVSARPGNGSTSSFNFGSTYGHLRGACIALGIPLIAEPIPVVWKRKIFGSSIFGKSKADQKTAARDKAREMYPAVSAGLKRVKDGDRAEALLLAHYGKLINQGGK